MMTQGEYSLYAVETIKERFSHISLATEIKDDDSIDIFVKSPKGLLTIGIGTFNTEITLGFKCAEGKSYWHTHMSLFGSYGPNEQIDNLTSLLNNIILDREPIFHSSKEGFYLTSDALAELNEQYHDETIKHFKWSEL